MIDDWFWFLMILGVNLSKEETQLEGSKAGKIPNVREETQKK